MLHDPGAGSYPGEEYRCNSHMHHRLWPLPIFGFGSISCALSKNEASIAKENTATGNKPLRKAELQVPRETLQLL